MSVALRFSPSLFEERRGTDRLILSFSLINCAIRRFAELESALLKNPQNSWRESDTAAVSGAWTGAAHAT
jgi:hypothetical protein